MPKKSPELTQGRSIPKRLKHLESGVSNWGKRWAKSPRRKNSAATSPGGEYNTFPVTGTTSEFCAGSLNTTQSSPSLSYSTVEGSSIASSSTGSFSVDLQPPVWQYGQGQQTQSTSRSRPVQVPPIAITVDPSYEYLRSSQESISPYTSTPSPIPSSGPHTPSSMVSPLSPHGGSSSFGSHASPNLSSISPHNASARARRPSHSMPPNEYAEEIFIFEPDADLRNPLLISGIDVPWDRRAIGPTCSSSTTLPLTTFDSPTTPRRSSCASSTQSSILQSSTDLNSTFPMFDLPNVNNNLGPYSAQAGQLLTPNTSASTTPSPSSQQSSLPSTHARSSYTPEYLSPTSASPSHSSPNYQQFTMPQSSYNGSPGSVSPMQRQATLTQSSHVSYGYPVVPQAPQSLQPPAISAPHGNAYTPIYIHPPAQPNGASGNRAIDGNGAYTGGYQQGYPTPTVDPRHSHTSYAYHPSYHPYRRV